MLFDLFLKYRRLKGNWGWKSRPNFGLFGSL